MKLIKFPEFKTVPCTEAANVKENIDCWLEFNKQEYIENFLRPDPKGYKGYRFVVAEDFDETIIKTQIISKVELIIVFKRIYYAPDHFSPLWFRELFCKRRLWGNLCF